MRTIDELKEELMQVKMKLQIEMEKNKTTDWKNYPSQHMIDQRDDMSEINDTLSAITSHGDIKDLQRVKSSSSVTNLRDGVMKKSVVEERKYSTMPRYFTGMDIIEEVTVARRTSVNTVPKDLGKASFFFRKKRKRPIC